MASSDSGTAMADGSTLSDGGPGEDRDMRRYVWGGIIAALISWLIVPVVGLVAVYCGWVVYQHKNRLQGGLIAGVGGVGVLTWVVYLLTM